MGARPALILSNDERMVKMYKEVKEIDANVMFAMGERIRKARLEKGMQSKEMALALDMSKDNYSRIENGTQLITTKTLYKIAQFHGLSLDYLMLGETEDAYAAEVKNLFKGKGLEKVRKAIAIFNVFFEG